jgi:hypothetical protein
MTYKRHRAIKCAFLIAPLLFALSCNQDPAILTEYEGVNLIANKGFDSPDWAPDQGSVYMTYEEVTGITLPSGVTGSAVYRLEIKNLVDDGEFEVSPIGTALGTLPVPIWSTTGTATAEVSGVAVESGQSLLFDIPASSDTIEFDLSTLTDGYPINSNYILRFSFVATDKKKAYWFYFPDYSISTPEINLRTAEVSNETITQDFPEDFGITTSEFTSVGGSDRFYITGVVQSGYIDNFRAARTDVPLRVRIDLAWADGNNPEKLSLVSGWYKFSIWVRSDPDAVFTQNRLASDHVTIGIENAVSVFPDTGSPLSMNGWASISTIIFVQIDTPDDPSERVLELSVSPTDIKYANSRDVGSILITAPSLELFTDEAAALESN